MKAFPQNFIWGTATSAHQTEGNNTNSDWWAWENRLRKKSSGESSPSKGAKYPLEPSGIACDSYTRYEEDFELCRQLNNNAVRLSIEWARLEPKEGVFDQNQFDHYKKVLACARQKGLKTFVTLHHFTNPIWFAKKGGWLNFKSPYYFSRYAQKCAQELGNLVNVFLTINEPQVYAAEVYLLGVWPPNKRSPISALICQLNMIAAHKAAYTSIKKVADIPVGIVKNIVWYEHSGSGFDLLGKVAVKLLFFLNSDFFLYPIRGHLDVLGLNYYLTRTLKGLKVCNKNDVLSDLGWWVYAKGLEQILERLRKYSKPLYITENGVADSDDRIRKPFIHDMLAACLSAINNGVPLKGYFYWSLIDNYEWHHGYWPKFGLVNIARQNNLQRIPRDTYYYYGEICKNNALED